MPITWLPNPNGGVLGVGLPLSFSSDTPDIPDGAIWRVIIYGEGGSLATWLEGTRTVLSGQSGATYRPFMNDPGWSEQQFINRPVTAGQTAHARAELEVGGVVVDTSPEISGTWDATTGLAPQIQAKQVSGGFTTTDRNQLNLAVANSTVSLTNNPVPTDLNVVPVGKLPGDVPLLWSERVGPFDLTGRGTLDLLGSNILGIWTGLRWFYSVIPPNWGMKPGAIDEFSPRPAQLVPIFVLQSGEEIGMPILDTNSSGGFERLELFAFTGKIAYDVSPGWTVSLFMYRVIKSG